MKLQKTLITGLVISMFGLNAFSVNADVIKGQNEKNKSEQANLDTLTCWEVSTLPEDDAAYALVLIYGYSAGKNNQPMHSSASMSQKIGAAGETCAQNPDMLVIEAF